MPTNVSWNDETYQVPNNREPKGWGSQLSAYLLALGNAGISLAGGVRSLTADLSFGINYGIIAKYFKSVSSDIAQSGVFRLANNEGIGWRNNANGADKILKTTTSDKLDFDGSEVIISDTPPTTKGDILAHNGTKNIKLGVGSNGQVLSADSAETTGLKWISALTNPMTTDGDLIRGGTSGAATRLAIGTDFQILQVVSGLPAWRSPYSYLQNLNQSTLSNNTETNVTASTLTLDAGTYLFEFGGEAYITHSTAPTSAEYTLKVTDNSNVGLAAAIGVTAATGQGYFSGYAQGLYEVTLGSSTTIKLRAQINVTGGTSLGRDIFQAWLKATRFA